MRDRGFAECVERELHGLLGYARVLTGDDHDAWDLTQEALVRVGMRWSRVHDGPNPVGYTRTTLARLTAVLGCSVGTARSHLSRGLDRMRRAVPEGDPRA